MKHILFALCALFALASSAEANNRIHVIRKGETLSGIAEEYLGQVSAYEELARINGIEDPNTIFAGAWLLIPDAVRNEQKSAKAAEPHITVKIVSVRLSDFAGNMPGVHLVGKISITVRATNPVVLALPSRSIHSSLSSFLSSACYSIIIDEIAHRVGIDSDLIRAIIRSESACDRMARSPKGALGLMQLMPDTLRLYRISDPFDAPSNIEGGARHLKELNRLFGNDLQLVLAAYNAGQGAVNKYGGIPPYPETRSFVHKVTNLLHKFNFKE